MEIIPLAAVLGCALRLPVPVYGWNLDLYWVGAANGEFSNNPPCFFTKVIKHSNKP